MEKWRYGDSKKQSDRFTAPKRTEELRDLREPSDFFRFLCTGDLRQNTQPSVDQGILLYALPPFSVALTTPGGEKVRQDLVTD